MNGWIIAAAALAALCGFLIARGARLKNQLQSRDSGAQELDVLRQELYAARCGEARRRRENAAIHRALQAEQRRNDELQQALDLQADQLAGAERRASEEEARRIAAEKSVSAVQMKVGLLEKQIETLEREQLAQEELYQDILRDREETIDRLQESHARRKIRRRPDILDQQISFNDLLKGQSTHE